VIIKLETLTQGRTDHVSTKNSTNNQLAGCYLIKVSNSGLLMTHVVNVGSSRLVKCISQTLTLTGNFDPWPRSRSRQGQGKPSCKVSIGQKSFRSTIIVCTHTHTVDRSFYLDH